MGRQIGEHWTDWGTIVATHPIINHHNTITTPLFMLHSAVQQGRSIVIASIHPIPRPLVSIHPPIHLSAISQPAAPERKINMNLE